MIRIKISKRRKIRKTTLTNEWVLDNYIAVRLPAKREGGSDGQGKYEFVEGACGSLEYPTQGGGVIARRPDGLRGKCHGEWRGRIWGKVRWRRTHQVVFGCLYTSKDGEMTAERKLVHQIWSEGTRHL